MLLDIDILAAGRVTINILLDIDILAAGRITIDICSWKSNYKSVGHPIKWHRWCLRRICFVSHISYVTDVTFLASQVLVYLATAYEFQYTIYICFVSHISSSITTIIPPSPPQHPHHPHHPHHHLLSRCHICNAPWDDYDNGPNCRCAAH